jgi:hypothetical protein
MRTHHGVMGTFGQGVDGHAPRREIDVAVGILIGLRGYSEREAFDELVGVVNRTGIGIFSVARSLAALATGTSTPQDSEAFNAWGELIRGRRPSHVGVS